MYCTYRGNKIEKNALLLVDPSPWPISGSLEALATTVEGVMKGSTFKEIIFTVGNPMLGRFLASNLFSWRKTVSCTINRLASKRRQPRETSKKKLARNLAKPSKRQGSKLPFRCCSRHFS